MTLFQHHIGSTAAIILALATAAPLDQAWSKANKPSTATVRQPDDGSRQLPAQRAGRRAPILVQTGQPPTHARFDWTDAAIGAAAGIAISLVAFGLTLVARELKAPDPHRSTRTWRRT